MPPKKEYKFIEKGYEDGVVVIIHAYSELGAKQILKEIVRTPAKFEIKP